MLEFFKKWLMPSRSLDKLEKDFEQASPIPANYASPHPHREADPTLEIVSQPIDGEAHPQVKQITRELTGLERER